MSDVSKIEQSIAKLLTYLGRSHASTIYPSTPGSESLRSYLMDTFGFDYYDRIVHWPREAKFAIIRLGGIEDAPVDSPIGEFVLADLRIAAISKSQEDYAEAERARLRERAEREIDDLLMPERSSVGKVWKIESITVDLGSREVTMTLEGKEGRVEVPYTRWYISQPKSGWYYSVTDEGGLFHEPLSFEAIRKIFEPGN